MLNNELFGQIKQNGFLVKYRHQAVQRWVEQMKIDQTMVDAFDMCTQQGEAWDDSEPSRLVSV